MSYNAWPLPYQAFRFSTWIPTPIDLCGSKRATPDRNPDRRDRRNDENNKNERSGPGLSMQVLIGRIGVVINLERQGRSGLIEMRIPELIAQGGKQQGSCLSCDAGE